MNSSLRKKNFKVLVCILGVALLRYKWRHPALPEGLFLPEGSRLTYSLRYVNPFLSGPGLYYRIELPQSQIDAAAYMRGTPSNKLEEAKGALRMELVSGAIPETPKAFEPVALRSSGGDTPLLFELEREQIFPVEVDSYAQGRVWRNGKGSTIEIFVWRWFY